MSDLKTAFSAAAQEVQKLKSRPSNDNLLQLYALYKQATEGDAKGSRPGLSISLAAPSTTPGPARRA